MSRSRAGADGSGREREEAVLRFLPPAPVCSRRLPTGSSLTVFHSPHASQRPTHLGCSWPHSAQRYTDRARATLGRLLSGAEVVEPGELAAEPEHDVAGGTVAMLGQHDLREAPLALVFFIVVLGAMDEDHDICVLLDRAGIAQVGQDR